jgi:hypothetical protein
MLGENGDIEVKSEVSPQKISPNFAAHPQKNLTLNPIPRSETAPTPL